MKNDIPDSCPLVSVVTLTYKNFSKVFETIQSVTKQDYPNIEYIVADDGSPDFPEKEIQQLLDQSNLSNTIVLKSTVNRGTVRNINNAYHYARGEIFINLSCGDIFFSPNTVSEIVDRFMKLACDVLVTTRILYKDGFVPISFLPHYLDRSKIEKWDSAEKQYRAFITSSFYDMASGSAMHFSKRILEKLDYFDESYVLWEDGPFIEKYLRKNTIETAYDIISIWYETSGVSSGIIHPLLLKDTIRFDQNERMDAYPKLCRWDKRKVDYAVSRAVLTDPKDRLLLKIRCLPVFVFFLTKWLRGKINSRIDWLIIRKKHISYRW